MSDPHSSTHTEHGASLARGPAWIVGSVLAVFGLVFFFKASGTPLSTGGFPQGDLDGRHFLGFEVNGWTAWLTAAAGVLVLIGSQQHAIAKATSLIVGIALAVAAGMALVASDVLGLAAANWVDALGWGVAAALLIVTALLPRLTHEVPDETVTTRPTDRDRARPSGGLVDRDHAAVPLRTSAPSGTSTSDARHNGVVAPSDTPTRR